MIDRGNGTMEFANGIRLKQDGYLVILDNNSMQFRILDDRDLARTRTLYAFMAGFLTSCVVQIILRLIFNV